MRSHRRFSFALALSVIGTTLLCVPASAESTPIEKFKLNPSKKAEISAEAARQQHLTDQRIEHHKNAIAMRKNLAKKRMAAKQLIWKKKRAALKVKKQELATKLKTKRALQAKTKLKKKSAIIKRKKHHDRIAAKKAAEMKLQEQRRRKHINDVKAKRLALQKRYKSTADDINIRRQKLREKYQR